MHTTDTKRSRRKPSERISDTLLGREFISALECARGYHLPVFCRVCSCHWASTLKTSRRYHRFRRLPRSLTAHQAGAAQSPSSLVTVDRAPHGQNSVLSRYSVVRQLVTASAETFVDCATCATPRCHLRLRPRTAVRSSWALAAVSEELWLWRLSPARHRWPPTAGAVYPSPAWRSPS